MTPFQPHIIESVHRVTRLVLSEGAARYAYEQRVPFTLAAHVHGISPVAVRNAFLRLYPGERWPRKWTAERAAQYAHDHHVTRMKAAQIFGVYLSAVDAAWESLYPDQPRVRT